MTTVSVFDTRTNETLHISYDSTKGAYTINDSSVKRQSALESRDDEFVFGALDGLHQKLYHVSREDLERLRADPNKQ